MSPAAPAPTDADAAFDVEAEVAELWVYPVKSCAGVSLREAELTPAGLDLDRTWMVVDAQGNFVTQRELPRMALVQTRIRSHDVVLRAPGMLALHLGLATVEHETEVQIWGQRFKAWDMGDVAAQWFTDFLVAPAVRPTAWTQIGRLRLVRFDPEVERLSSMTWTQGVAAWNQFSDGYPVLVASQASLDELNRRLAQTGVDPVAMARFRPNVVLRGVESHDEDRCLDLTLGGGAEAVVLQLVKPCPRCPIPNIDPATGLSTTDVGDALQGYRQDPRVDGAVTFGMNAIVRQGAGQTLRVGQRVRGRWNF